MKRNIAFTLAEVLITLGIIGIVAALTIPSLVAKHQEKQTVAQLKKFYSVMNNAMLRAIEENGEVSNWGLSTSILDDTEAEDGDIDESSQGRDKFIDIITKYLNTTSICKYSDNKCEIWYGKNLKGLVNSSDNLSNRIILNDGTIITNIHISHPKCDYVDGNNVLQKTYCGPLKVDLNGKNPPNIQGRDIFDFMISAKGIYPGGSQLDYMNTPLTSSGCSKNTTGRTGGLNCTAWVLYQENMDYLHCDDLSWNGKHKCK